MHAKLLGILVYLWLLPVFPQQINKTTEKLDKKSSFSVRFYSELTTSVFNVNRSQDSVGNSIDFLSVYYKFNEKESLRYTAFFTTSGVRFYDDDHFIEYERKGIDFFGERTMRFRLHMPSSQASRLLGRYILRADTLFIESLNETFTFIYFLSPRGMLYTKHREGQAVLDMIHGPIIIQKISKKFSGEYFLLLRTVLYSGGDALTPGAALSSGGFSPATLVPRTDTNIIQSIIRATLYYNITSQLKLGGFIEHFRNIETAGFRLFNEQESVYGLLLSVNNGMP